MGFETNAWIRTQRLRQQRRERRKVLAKKNILRRIPAHGGMRVVVRQVSPPAKTKTQI